MKRALLQLAAAAAVALCPAHGEVGVGGAAAKLCTWPPHSPPSLFPVPVSCYDVVFLSFFLLTPFLCALVQVKEVFKRSVPPGTAGWAEHQGSHALEHVSGQISLPLLISPASVSPGKHNIAMWHWNSVHAAGAKVRRSWRSGVIGERIIASFRWYL